MASKLRYALVFLCSLVLVCVPCASYAADAQTSVSAVSDAIITRTITAPAAAFCDVGEELRCAFVITSPATAASSTEEVGPQGGLSVSGGSQTLAAPADASSCSQTATATLSVDSSKFSHAGVYEYLLQDQRPEGLSSSWQWSQDSYRIRVYIRNANAQEQRQALVCYGITAGHISSAQNGLAAQATKVDVSKIGFAHSYQATSQLVVKKLIEGAYADKSHAFKLACTLTLPASSSEGGTLSYDLLDASGQTISSNKTATISGRSCTITESLADGQSFLIKDVPVGTSYSLVESDASWHGAYVPTGSFVYSAAAGDTTTTTQVGSAGQQNYQVAASPASSSAEALASSTTVGSGTGNAVTITNTLDEAPSPTGIVIAQLPYVLLLALPILGGALALSARRLRSRS